jgi:hypothetical protein
MPDHDYIPGGDHEFDNWQSNFVNQVNTFLPLWNLSDAALDEWDLLTNTQKKKKLRWEKTWRVVASKGYKRSDIAEKKAARKDYENGHRNNIEDTSLRIFIARYIRNNPLVTIVQKKKCRLTIPADRHTPTTESNSDFGDSLTVAIWRMSHFKHIIKVYVPGKKSVAKGKGIDSIQVYLAITDVNFAAPPKITEYRYDGTVVRGFHSHTFDQNEAGLLAWYITRKIMKGNRKKLGIPSIPYSAIIP